MNIIKRAGALLCAAAMMLSLAACGAQPESPDKLTSGDGNQIRQDSNDKPDEKNPDKNEPGKENETVEVTRTDLKIVADMIHDNPGRPDYVSAYTDPQTFVDRGVNSKVFDLADAAQYGLLWDGYTVEGTNESIFSEKEQQWILDKRAALIKSYKAYKDAGIKVYFMMDMMVLPKNMSKTGLDYKTNGKIDIRKDDTKKMIADMFDEMFKVFVDEKGASLIDGIFVRTGETYTGERFMLPHHEGNNPLDVYKADAANDSEANVSCHTDFVNILREELCVKHNKELIYRTWSFGAFHNDRETYLSVSDKIEPHENLYFCIKYVAGDFFRNVSFNQCLNAGKHQQIVEVQSAREYEGKGAYPNYIGDGVINGFKEYEWSMSPEQNKSLRDIINVEDSKVVGVWTWARGGGWDGPYINGNGEPLDPDNPLTGDYGKPDLGHAWGDELWADVNSYVVQKWAQDTSKTDKELATEYAVDILKMSEKDAESFYELLLKSSDAVLLGRATNTPGVYINGFFTRDDVLDNMTTWGGTQGFVDELMEKMSKDDFAGKAIAREREESVKLWEEIIKIAESFDDSVEKKDYMILTSKYGYYLYSLYNTVLKTGAYAKQVEAGNLENEDKIPALIEEYDRLWAEWEQLYQENEDCPTLFHRDDFRAGDGATRGSFDGVMNRYRTYETEKASEMAPGENAVILYENSFDDEGKNDISSWTLRNPDASKPEIAAADGVLTIKQAAGIGSTNWYEKKFDAASGKIYVFFDMKITEDGDNPAFFIIRGSNGANIVQFDWRDLKIGLNVAGGWEAVTPAGADEWRSIKFVIDTEAQKLDMYVGDEKVISERAFREASNDVGIIQISPYGGAAQTMYVDNILVYTK